jgi:signal transduction histidine kinase
VRSSIPVAVAIVAVGSMLGVLVAVRLATPDARFVTPADALPALLAGAALLGATLLRARSETGAWLATIVAGAIVTIDLASAARGLRDQVDAAAWDWLTIAIGLAALATVGAAVAYAVSRPSRLGRWVGPAGVVAIGAVLVATAWALADDPVSSLVDPSPLGPTGRVTRTFLVVTVGAVLVGLAGDARGPWLRARRRVAALDSTTPDASAGPWPSAGVVRAFLDEIRPGRERARQAAVAERARFARDLHADVVPGLRRALALADEGRDLDRLAAQLRSTLAEVEDLGAAEHAVQLDIGGLVAAIEWLAERTEASAGVTVAIDIEDPSPVDDAAVGDPPPDVAAAAFRVVGLALDNVVRHAPGSDAAIRVVSTPGRVEVVVTDDGPGLTPEARTAALAAGRRGLVDMTTEAIACGGRLDVGPGPDGGTRVAFRWSAV